MTVLQYSRCLYAILKITSGICQVTRLCHQNLPHSWVLKVVLSLRPSHCQSLLVPGS